MPKIMTPAQLANLAKGRAAAKAKREAAARGEAPKAPLEFIQQAPQAPKGPALDHDAARAKLRELGLQACQLPGRTKSVTLGAWTVTNEKGKFTFTSSAPQPKAEAKAAPEITAEQVLAWLTARGMKI